MSKIALALLLFATPLLAGGRPAGTSITVPYVQAGHIEITRAAVVASMNANRAAAGLPPLHEDARLDDAADDRMRDMEENEYWAHDSPDGRSPFLMFKPHGYDFTHAGENLASGFDTAEVLEEAWMESDGHRANIMSPLYDDCGVAIIDGATTGRASGKSIVVLFGRARVPYIESPAKPAPAKSAVGKRAPREVEYTVNVP